MQRVVAIACFILAGCDAGNGVVPDLVGAAPTQPAAIADSFPEVVDESLVSLTAAWPKAIDRPVLIEKSVSMSCVSNTGDRFGPHYKPAIVVRTNPEAIEAYRAKQTPMPVGTVVFKEKHDDEAENGPWNEFGAMIKREPGYDPEHGDWEYVYGTLSPEVKVERGKLQSCIECHSAYAQDNDYLFRSYLPDVD